MGKASIISVSGTTTDLTDRPDYDQARKIVGGYLEYVHLGRGRTLVVNEEGLFLNLPTNDAATQLCVCKPNIDRIVGDVILLEGWLTVGPQLQELRDQSCGPTDVNEDKGDR